MTFTRLDAAQLPQAEHTNTSTFEGYRFGTVNLSFFLVDNEPGAGVRLHRHPCEEIFIIQEGCVRYTLGAEVIDAAAGEIIIVPPGVPHRFVSMAPGRLRQIDILPTQRIVTEWLADV